LQPFIICSYAHSDGSYLHTFQKNDKWHHPLRIISYFRYEMNRNMIKTKLSKPTESELEILAVLWGKQTATVRTVHEELSKTKDAGYTTTLKLMQIMFEKNLVTRDESSKTHIYAPAVTKEKTQKQFLNRMIDGLFAGSTTELVLQALGNNNTSNAELDKIRSLIDELKLKK
jgi:BlaI family transcriptional regulator, penicillinase repressor